MGLVFFGCWVYVWLRSYIYSGMEFMIERSDAFVIFPGGAGTVQEFLALLLLLETGDSLMKGKPIVVYDRTDRSGKNFWEPLINLLKEKGYSDYFTVVKELNMIIKSDVHGSSEAIKNAISQIKHEEVKPKIILADIGMVTETDVTLAKASNAVLIAFNVKPSKEAKKLAENEKIKISTYNIIYEVLDYVKQKMSGLLAPDIQEKITGTAQILEIFKVSGAGKVAGSKITDGEINSTSDVRVIRDGSIIYTGKVGTLFREKNQVKQVSNGQECGITVKDYMDFQKNDTIEAFSVTSTERSI